MTEFIYGQYIVSGTARQRAHSIHISNPREGAPSIVYEEERIAEADGQIIHLPLIRSATQRGPGGRQLGGQVDLQDTIALRDMTTGELTGDSVPLALIYQTLYSDYLNRAFARDNQASE